MTGFVVKWVCNWDRVTASVQIVADQPVTMAIKKREIKKEVDHDLCSLANMSSNLVLRCGYSVSNFVMLSYILSTLTLVDVTPKIMIFKILVALQI